MRTRIKFSPLNLMIALIGAGIIVAAILLFALQPSMSWQSDVIIGVIMAVAIWATLNVPLKYSTVKREHHHLRQE